VKIVVVQTGCVLFWRTLWRVVFMGIGSVIKKYGYHNNCIIDNLPSAAVGLSPSTGEKQKHYAGGFPIGFVSSDTHKPFIYKITSIS
jgi:transmembrane 9 superfamily protein 2/4